MSDLACTYYQQRSEKFSIGSIPNILNGQPVALIDDSQFISVQQPETTTGIAFIHQFEMLLKSTHQFIWAAVPAHYTDPKTIDKVQSKRNKAFLKESITKLLVPSAIKTGRVRHVYAEALAGSEVSKVVMNKIKKNRPPGLRDRHNETEDTEVYIALAATLTHGARTIRVVGLTIMRAILLSVQSHFPQKIIAIQYIGQPMKQNELLGKGLLSDVRITNESVTAYNMSHPFVNSIGTGRQQRGKR